MDWSEVIQFARDGNPEPLRREQRTEEEWRERLSPDAYQVARLKGTERAFSSPMCSLFVPGLYACTCCGTELFDSAQQVRERHRLAKFCRAGSRGSGRLSPR